mmetsp:Transcript_20421/g.39192  ORF Transcript_20421/g.39192 Transcript_20421/m.39192 type:complete len:80 (-) Transcript_20421:129-368(-)
MAPAWWAVPQVDRWCNTVCLGYETKDVAVAIALMLLVLARLQHVAKPWHPLVWGAAPCLTVASQLWMAYNNSVEQLSDF